MSEHARRTAIGQQSVPGTAPRNCGELRGPIPRRLFPYPHLRVWRVWSGECSAMCQAGCTCNPVFEQVSIFVKIEGVLYFGESFIIGWFLKHRGERPDYFFKNTFAFFIGGPF